MKRYVYSAKGKGSNLDQLFDLCQSEIDDLEDDYDNDTIDTLYDTLVSAVEFRLDRELTDEEQSLIMNWLESDSFTFPKYDDDYFED